MPSVSITWHTQGDDRVCPICQAINNYTWTFTDTVPDSLHHPMYGEIWNIHTGSLAHEHRQFGKKYGLMSNCRCHITTEQNLKDVLEAIEKLLDEFRAAYGDDSAIDDTKGGQHRKTTFEDIGVDPSKYGVG